MTIDLYVPRTPMYFMFLKKFVLKVSLCLFTEEDPLYPHLETSDHADLKHHVTSPRSQGGLLSQDSGLQSQDSGFVNSMG